MSSVVSDKPQNAELIAFGHSQMVAVDFAYRKVALQEPCTPRVAFLQMRNPEFFFAYRGADRVALIADSVASRIGTEWGYGRREKRCLFAFLGGNEHHEFSLVKGARPFDFVAIASPNLQIENGAEILPQRAIEGRLRRTVGAFALELHEIRNRVEGRIIAVSSPPPIPDNDYLLNEKSAFFEQMARDGVSPPTLRLKTWQLRSLIMQEYCAADGIEFLSPPKSAVDEAGYMVRDGWHPDGVHGSTWYGEHVLNQMIALGRAETGFTA